MSISPDLQQVLNHSWQSAKGHAHKRGFAFELPKDFPEKLYNQQHGKCAVSGVEFSLQPSFPENLVKHPFAPSIDRKLWKGGYTTDNVRLVCVAVNFGMGQFGEEVFLRIARAAVRFDRERATIPDVEEEKWRAAVQERLEAAESLLPSLPEDEQPKQRQRIAGFKAALRRGRKGSRQAAIKAWKTIRAARGSAAVPN
jgi:hypothetical protein